MIGLLKKPLSVDLQIRMKGNSLNPLVAQNKDLGAASQTLLTAVKLRLRRCPNNRIFILSPGKGWLLSLKRVQVCLFIVLSYFSREIPLNSMFY